MNWQTLLFLLFWIWLATHQFNERLRTENIFIAIIMIVIGLCFLGMIHYVLKLSED